MTAKHKNINLKDSTAFVIVSQVFGSLSVTQCSNLEVRSKLAKTFVQKNFLR